nr:PREDICTED: tripartite motif-containing protein 52-like isoform X2 [Lepisosteus oculatus]
MASALVEELQCPVCLGLFSDPVTLPCGHTFCRGCLESYLATDVPVHLCPECRAPIPRRDFRTNRVLRNMADRARQEEEKVSEQTDLLCVEHDEKLKLFCETDGTLICLVCRDSSSHRGHGFKPVQEAAQEFRVRPPLFSPGEREPSPPWSCRDSGSALEPRSVSLLKAFVELASVPASLVVC